MVFYRFFSISVLCISRRLAPSVFPLVVFSFSVLSPFAAAGQDTRQLERVNTGPAKLTAEKRTALVIGNYSYATSPLANPVNDATDMATALKELDFEVISGVDRSREDMIRLIRRFGDRLKDRGGVGLFYCAGHGIPQTHQAITL